MSELQQVTMRDIFTTAGLSIEQVGDLLAMLTAKRERVQLAFYYRSQGMTFGEVGERVGVARQVATRMVRDECADMAVYLRNAGAFQ